MTNAILLDGRDNVATCTAPAQKDDAIKILGGDEIICVENIPAWHKVALRPIAAGEKIFKYGEIIGEASTDIAAGAWVSHKNIFSVPRDYNSELI
ncbi:MAG: UxaA family hydrolase [Selenomonadaceae bacterium]|nr:UxaA family hydrolase [Selenomonadaceae bacterium]